MPMQVDTAYHHQGWAIFLTLLLVAVAIGLTYAGRPKGAEAPKPYAVVLGKDCRLSTSKLVAMAWTIVLSYFLLVLIFNSPDWNKALSNLAPNYLLFLAGPYAALVLAKAAVSTRVSNGTLLKPPSDGNVRLSDLFNDDRGQPDLFDVQYVIFNVIAIVFAVVNFSPRARPGFPRFRPVW